MQNHENEIKNWKSKNEGSTVLQIIRAMTNIKLMLCPSYKKINVKKYKLWQILRVTNYNWIKLW